MTNPTSATNKLKKILVVEHYVELQKVYKLILEEAGYEYHAALDGQTGLDMSLKGQYDLLLINNMMPALNGWEICEKVKEAGIKVPIIYTGSGGNEALNKWLQKSGVTAFLYKPFDLEKFEDTIKKALGEN